MRVRVWEEAGVGGFVHPISPLGRPIESNGAGCMATSWPRQASAPRGFAGPGLGCGQRARREVGRSIFAR